MTDFPAPSGPHPVGTVVRHLVDRTRIDIFDPRNGAHRGLVLQIWYPADRPPDVNSARRAPYVDDVGLLEPLADLMRLPAHAFDGLRTVDTAAFLDAPVAGDRGYPVLVFVHGRCGFRGQNTALIEELVSHGYVVAAVDQPHVSSGVLMPDGRRTIFSRLLLPPWPRELLPGLDRELMSQVMAFLTRDLTFVVDELERINKTDPDGMFGGHLNMSQLGVVGVSLGGILAANACLADDRFGACIVVDAYLSPEVVREGLRTPVMWITRDAGTMCLEGWGRADIDDVHNSMCSVFERLPDAGYRVLIPGMYHVDFSDGRLLSPLIAERGISGSVPLERALGLVSGYARAFLDEQLKKADVALLHQPAMRPREVLFDGRSAAGVALD